MNGPSWLVPALLGRRPALGCRRDGGMEGRCLPGDLQPTWCEMGVDQCCFSPRQSLCLTVCLSLYLYILTCLTELNAMTQF